MKRGQHDQASRRLIEAEGYLELDMAEQALAVLDSTSWDAEFQFPAHFLRGLVLRDLERHVEAVDALEAAHRARPDDANVLLALGWCLKRANQLPRAIQALERASQAEPDVALVHYNLACYHALAGECQTAIDGLKRALELEPDLRRLVPDESDFDPVRNDPRFRRLLEGGGSVA
jgi:tetratricopeptide (TPR) repeat protein